MLPTQNADVAHGTLTTIAGWGYNETNDEECRKRLKEIGHPSHICAEFPEDGRGGHSYSQIIFECNAGRPLIVNDIVVALGSWSVTSRSI